jgi:hypothetical protein
MGLPDVRVAKVTTREDYLVIEKLSRCTGLVEVDRGSGASNLIKEVIALVVHNDECGEVLHFNLPHRFHAKFRIFKDFNLCDAILGKSCSWTTY